MNHEPALHRPHWARPAVRFRLPDSALVASLAVFLTSLGIYLLTLAPDLTWRSFGADGGELITASSTLGVPHPPGYPTYVLLGRLFSLIPLGNVAFRYNLFSAVCVSVAAAFLSAAAFETHRHRRQSDRSALEPGRPIAAALVFAFSSLVWGQATIAEVYGLNLAVVATLLWWLAREHRRNYALVTGLLFGLSLTTHLTSILLLPLILRNFKAGRLHHILAGLALGLSPLLLLPLLAQGASPVVWGDAATTAGWWDLVTARLYQPNVFGLAVQALPGRLVGWLGLAGIQLAGLALVLLPLWLAGRLSWPQRGLPVAATFSAGLYGVYTLAYSSVDAINHLLPALLLIAFVLASTLRRAGAWAFLLPVVLVFINLPSQQIAGQERPLKVTLRLDAAQVLAELPTGAIAISPGDNTIFALWYFAEVEQQRPDVTLVDSGMFQFDWYRARLRGRHPRLQSLEEDNVAVFVADNVKETPVCHVSLQPASVDCVPIQLTSPEDEIIQ